ncbi:Serine dehydrogenase proteinase [Bacteroides heparinolyticus]|uniref:Serine dehydrogenase proteinase n=1 Tax=Prevotella heparinolytica TaxID=28113 RepID=A0A449I4Q5_9BACE|nr:serine dehydrogenasease [Bacteroides heparinolyticus]VFB14362.1 Serine dehydrogenase proteinase [Bacteroides heparinolyticus]
MEFAVDLYIQNELASSITKIEDGLSSDVLLYYGPIDDALVIHVDKLINGLYSERKHDRLTVILTTSGGSATAAERYVNIFRAFYSEVDFLIPDYAYSAGTILSLSGDNILMDYLSVLGPIDPQVRNKEGHWVPALGYLDKIYDLLEKAQKGEISQAEFIILKDFDLAELRAYEQAKELTIDLLERWLVKYKFKNWKEKAHSKTPVTDRMKKERAQEIAKKLSDNNLWKSHGRPINIDRLVNELNLKITDYSTMNIKEHVKNMYAILFDYTKKQDCKIWLQTRKEVL